MMWWCQCVSESEVVQVLSHRLDRHASSLPASSFKFSIPSSAMNLKKKSIPTQALSSVANLFSTGPRVSEESVLDKDIEALRTMLTLLSKIKPIQPKSSLKEPPTPTDAQSKECKVLTALATVLVMEHEKVAVVAKYGNIGWGAAEVFACTDSISNADCENTKSLTASM